MLPTSTTISRRSALLGLAGGLAATLHADPLERGVCVATTRVGRFESFTFTDEGVCHQVYVIGNGPPVIMLHELPGLTDDDLRAAEKLAGAKFTVIAPLLFGDAGGAGDWYKYYRSICGPEKFGCNEPHKTTPEVRWMRKLVVEVRRRWPEGKGVGVVGMCLTGALPLALMSEKDVVAPVLCQPTVPFNAWTRVGFKTDERALGISDEDLMAAKARNIPLLGIRYKGDWRCRNKRFQRLTEEFGSRFYRLDVRGSHHSTLGGNFSNDAFQEVAAFLSQQLHDTPAGPFPRQSMPGSMTEVVPKQPDKPAHH